MRKKKDFHLVDSRRNINDKKKRQLHRICLPEYGKKRTVDNFTSIYLHECAMMNLSHYTSKIENIHS